MEDIVETIEEKKSSNNSFVEVSSIDIQKETVEHSTESYFDGKLLSLLAFSYFYATITVLTAGLLSAWGKCLLNKYIYNHTVISGKRLRFEGTGEDLFPKMFKWDFFRLITFNIYSIWQPTRYKEWEVSKLHFEDEKLVEGSSYFTGSVLGYFGIRLLCNLITIASFGILQPVAYVIRLKWELEHTIINNKVVVFRGSMGQYFVKRILWTLLSAVTFGIYGFWFHINTLKWQFSNTFLLRKNEKGAKELSESTNLTSSSASVKSGKKPNKFVILGVVGVVAIIFIVLLVNIISFFGPKNEAAEQDIITTANEASQELKTIGLLNADENLGTGSMIKSIKKLHMNALDNYRRNGGKGLVESVSNSPEIPYYSLRLLLIKKSTACIVDITNTNDPYIDCDSVTNIFLERLNIKSRDNNYGNSKYIEEYDESYYNDYSVPETYSY